MKNSHTGADVLDICSSWVSHYPQNLKMGRVAGTGMNERELRANTQLTEFTPVWKSKFYGAIRIAASTSTPSTRHLLDGVAMPVPATDALVDFHTGSRNGTLIRRRSCRTGTGASTW